MRKILWFTVGFAFCCVLGFYFASGNLPLWLAPVILALAVGLLLLPYKPSKIVGVVCLGFAIGVLWIWGYNAVYLQPAKVYDGEMVSAQFEIADYSYETRYGSAADGKVSISGRKYNIRIYFDDVLELKPGDIVCGQFKLGLTIPKGEEESSHYQGKGIFFLAEAEGEIVVEPADEIPARYFPAKLHRQIIMLLEKLFPADVLGFIRALFLGDSTLLTYEEDTAFKVSGIRHIIAVSGLHVSILFSLVYAMVGRQRYLTAVACIPALLLFAAVVGFTPSITRACIMQSLMAIAIFVNREDDPPTALAFAVLVMLAINPMTITSVNLQLSVCCVIGILLFSKRLSTYILVKLGWPTGKSFRAKLSRWFAGSVSVTLSAMSVTTPLVAFYFGMVSLIGVLTNLATLWVISFIFYGIILSCIVGALWLPWGKLIASAIAWPARYVLQVANVCASVPFGAVYTRSIYVILWIAVCYLMFAIFLLCKKKRPGLLAGCAAVCLVTVIIANCVQPRMDEFRVTVFDVGEGQSILFQDEGQNYLIDCGGDSPEEVADQVAETLLNQGVFVLDGIILTHYDTDHAAGVPGLLSRVDAKRLYLPRISDNSGNRDLILQKLDHKTMWIYGNTEIKTKSGTITLLPAFTDGASSNENSLCILFQRENCDILITGDRGRTGELALLETVDLPKLTLLIAGHHGANSSTSFELLRETKPDVVVISTGGKYGHPSEDVLYRLSLFDCAYWRTDRDGTLVFRR